MGELLLLGYTSPERTAKRGAPRSVWGIFEKSTFTEGQEKFRSAKLPLAGIRASR